MERLAICRICLTVNVSHLIPDMQLQEVYEKLTSLSFQNPMKPSLMCYVCRAQLYRAHRLMLQCLKAEGSFTQIFNQLLAIKGQVQQELIEIDGTKVTPLICTPVQHIDIEPDTEKIRIIYEEDVTHIKTEVESVDELSDALHQVSDHSVDNKQTYFDPEYYTSLNYVKENTGRVTDEHNIARIVKKEPIGWIKDASVVMKSKSETQTNKNEVNKFNTDLIKRAVTHDQEETTFECSIDTKASIFCVGITDAEINDIQNGGNKSENKYTIESLVVNESDASNIERDDNLMISNINLNNVTSDHRHDKGFDMENFKQCKISQNNNRNCKSSSSSFFTHAKDETRFICDICRRNFSCKSQLVRHVRIHTGDKPYSCKICDKRFTEISHLKTHERIHTGEKLYSCKVCDKRFMTKNNLKSHELIHTGEKPYSCEMCDKKFAKNGNLKIHERIHSGERPYSCKICDKRFRAKNHLKSHELLHTGEKPYSCEICDKKFAKKSTLKIHERIHTGVRPYICKICDKGFAIMKTLKTHEHIHSGERPYICKICDKRFTQSGSLKTHERIHTGEKPYICKICNMRFATVKTLKTHERKHTIE